MLLSLPGAEQEDTPLTLHWPHARGSFILLRPGPPRVPAEQPPARPRQRAQQSRKTVFFGGPPRGRCVQPAGQPRGGVRATSPASPGGPRPPTGRRPSADPSEGFRTRSPRPPEGTPRPAPPAPCPRGPHRLSRIHI